MSTFHLILECSFRVPAGRAAGSSLQKSIAIVAAGPVAADSRFLQCGSESSIGSSSGVTGSSIDRSNDGANRSWRARRRARSSRPFALRGITIEDPMHKSLYAAASWSSKKVAPNAPVVAWDQGVQPGNRARRGRAPAAPIPS